MKKTIFYFILLSIFIQNKSFAINNPDDVVIETITFTSGDGLINVTADTYIDNTNTEFILLCHQAGYSRGEYIETAPILADMGFNCMAIDQRSGNQVNGVINQTALEANAQGLPQNYFNAIPDIESAIDKAYELNGNNPIYLLGSSYSAALSLVIGRDNTKVKAVITFSPGEYISEFNIANEISSYTKPVFTTSSQAEINGIISLFSQIDSTYLTHFQPTVTGRHGSSSLWSSTVGHEQYWDALEAFLMSTLPTDQNTITDFLLYPNPTNGEITIKAIGLKKVVITTILGKKIKEITNPNSNKIVVKEKGIYYIKVYTNKGIGLSKIIIK